LIWTEIGHIAFGDAGYMLTGILHKTGTQAWKYHEDQIRRKFAENTRFREWWGKGSTRDRRNPYRVICTISTHPSNTTLRTVIGREKGSQAG